MSNIEDPRIPPPTHKNGTLFKHDVTGIDYQVIEFSHIWNGILGDMYLLHATEKCENQWQYEDDSSLEHFYTIKTVAT